MLIDYENVQPAALTMLDHEQFKIIVFVGASQTKITFEVAAALQQMGARAQYVKVSGNGSNALDFHIAFYIGQLAAQEPDACFHIISKDTGFDPLIQHLKSKKLLVYRSCDVTDIPIVRWASATSSAEQLAVIVTDLQRRGTAKPRSVKTLVSTINAIFQRALSDDEAAALVHQLHLQGIITIDNTKISYALPA